MKKVFFISLIVLSNLTSAAVAESSESQTDTLQIKKLNEVVISGVKAHYSEPFAVTEIDRQELDRFSKNGQELPFLFARTPGVTAWSENGTGIGTTYMRIRGAGDSRINVTLDGVALNSPEDQCVFWANMNSYASLLGTVQIQRGLGTSTVGDGAFGGSIVLGSKLPNPNPNAEITSSFGSFGTMRAGGTFSSGTIGNSFILDGAFHHTVTQGYIHGTDGKMGSYYAGALWTPSENVMIRYRNIGNYERTGQAWNGITAGNSDMSLMDGCYIDESWNYNQPTGIKEYSHLCNVGLGQYNDLYESIVTTPEGLFAKDSNGKYITERHKWRDGNYTNGTTDNFWQDHNILSLIWDNNKGLSTSFTAHYTYGYGYYQEFRPNNKLTTFGLTNALNENGDKVWRSPDGTHSVRKTDFEKNKGLEQHTYGAIWNINYHNERVEMRGGLSYQGFWGDHWGYLTYVADEVLSNHLLGQSKYRYYFSDAAKHELSAHIKATYHINDYTHAFADLQLRGVTYMTGGKNDKFIVNTDGMTYSNQQLDVDAKHLFINPRIGLSWIKDAHKIHALIAMANREPERNNYTDNGSYPAPRPERMTDIEAGYAHTGNDWNASINLYFMNYHDQFVQNGMVSDIGEKLTTNINRSYRTGVELAASYSPLAWLQIEANAALSSNKIMDFDEIVETYDDYWNQLEPTQIHYNNSTLAYSPSAVVNGFVNICFSNFKASWHTGYVSRQYLDNTTNTNRSIPAYTITNVWASYTLAIKKVAREVELGININNLFNGRYATNGWVYSSILGSVHPEENRYYQIGFTPMTAISTLGSITIRF